MPARARPLVRRHTGREGGEAPQFQRLQQLGSISSTAGNDKEAEWLGHSRGGSLADSGALERSPASAAELLPASLGDYTAVAEVLAIPTPPPSGRGKLAPMEGKGPLTIHIGPLTVQVPCILGLDFLQRAASSLDLQRGSQSFHRELPSRWPPRGTSLVGGLIPDAPPPASRSYCPVTGGA